MPPFFLRCHSCGITRIMGALEECVRFFDSAVNVLATQITALVTVFLINLLISRTLGEEGKGLVALCLYIPEVLFGLSNLALGISTQYFVSRREGDPRVYLGNLFFFPLLSGGLLLLTFLLTYRFWQPQLQNLSLHTFLPGLLLLPLFLISEPLYQLLIALGRVTLRNLAVLVQSILTLAIVAFLLVLGWKAPQVMWGYVAAWGVSTVVILTFAIRSVQGPPRFPSLSLFVRTMRYGIWMFLGNVVVMLFTRVDFFFLAAIRGVADAGVYSIALGMTTPILIVSHSVQTIFYPKISSLTDNDATLTTTFYYRQMIIVSLLLAGGLALFARPVLGLFGAGFVRGHYPMLILLLAAVLKGINAILMNHILGRGESLGETIRRFTDPCHRGSPLSRPRSQLGNDRRRPCHRDFFGRGKRRTAGLLPGRHTAAAQ